MTDIKTIKDIDPAHRVLNIGLYNNEVFACGFCDSDARIDTLGRDCLGFGVPDRQSSGKYNTIAVVYKCPACFERQWSHGAVTGSYKTYLKYIERNV
jgi:hypothetical protein